MRASPASNNMILNNTWRSNKEYRYYMEEYLETIFLKKTAKNKASNRGWRFHSWILTELRVLFPKRNGVIIIQGNCQKRNIQTSAGWIQKKYWMTKGNAHITIDQLLIPRILQYSRKIEAFRTKTKSYSTRSFVKLTRKSK